MTTEEWVPISETVNPVKFYHIARPDKFIAGTLTYCGLWTGSSCKRDFAERHLRLCSKCNRRRPLWED